MGLLDTLGLGNPDLKALKKRRDALTTRVEALRTELDAARAVEADVQDRLAKTRLGLAEGTAIVDAVRKLHAEANVVNATSEEVAAALRAVESEVEAATQAVADEEHRAEVARQTRESETLRQEADALYREQVKRLATLWKPFVERQKRAEEIRSKYPLSPPLDVVVIHRLARDVGEQWEGAVIANDQAHRDDSIRTFIRLALTPYESNWPQEARRLGIDW